MRAFRNVAALLLFIILALQSTAALAGIGITATWSGNGADANWSTGANWAPPAAPPADADVVFPAGANRLANDNDLAPNTAFSTVTFNGGGGGYILDGNAFGVKEGLTASNTAGTNTINNDVQLGASIAFTSTAAGTDLIFGGELSLGANTLTAAGAGDMELQGPVVGAGGSIIKNGAGTLRLAGDNTYDGATTINEGTLFLDNSSVASSAVTLAGGVLAGDGSCGALTATGGTISPGSSVGAIIVGNGLALGANSTFEIEVNGPSGGAGFDEIDVTGPVQVGGALDVTFGFTPVAGDEFIIIDNDGTDAVTGEFASFPQGSSIAGANAPVVIAYSGGDGNDVALAVPTLAVDDIEVTEDATEVTVQATFTVSLSVPSLETVTVDYATADGTATAPLDYAPQSGTLTFAPMETEKEISIDVNGDVIEESDETFTVTLSNPSNALIGTADGTCTIHNEATTDGSTGGCGCIISEEKGGSANALSSAFMLVVTILILRRCRVGARWSQP